MIKIKKVFLFVLMFLSTISLFSCGCNHQFGEWEVIVKPTCVKEGAMSCKCHVCGEVITKTIDPTGHNYVDGVCTICGAKEF